MSKRMSAFLQREALIRAGFELAEKLPPEKMTAQALAKRARLPPRSLTQQFGSMEGFAEAVQKLHYDEMRRHMLAFIEGQNSGVKRILSATQAYFDFSFMRRGLRAWMSEVRARSPDMLLHWRMDNQLYAQFVANELALCGWPHPLAGARLYVAAVVELVRHEQRRGQKLPAARRALERFLHTHERTAFA